jgi:hypothetical protein
MSSVHVFLSSSPHSNKAECWQHLLNTYYRCRTLKWRSPSCLLSHGGTMICWLILIWRKPAAGQWLKHPAGGWHSLSICAPGSSSEPQLWELPFVGEVGDVQSILPIGLEAFLVQFFLPTLNLQVLNIRKGRKCFVKIAGEKVLSKLSQGDWD